MSFGDGKAKCISTIGIPVILSSADGKAIVNSGKKKPAMVIQMFPFSNDRQPYGKNSIMSEARCKNRVKINNGTLLVGKAKTQKIIPVDSYNKIAVYSINNMASATCNVMTKGINYNNNDKNYLFQYIEISNDYIDNKTIYSLSNNGTMIEESNSRKILCYKRIKPVINIPYENSNSINVFAVPRPRLVFDVPTIMVQKIYEPKANSDIKINNSSIFVEPFKAPDIGNLGSGSGLKGFRLVLQKMSYVEQSLLFVDGEVKEILGLPNGMIFEHGCLKGSPLLSGKYAISIKLSTSKIISGIIIVSQVPRQL